MAEPAPPSAVAQFASDLALLPGVEAVALGGSRAVGTQRPDSDWDLGLYYRGRFDPGRLRDLGHRGHVSALGEWGPVVNGGAWLTVGDTPVDVLFRDLDVVERWCAEAEHGRFEVLAQTGYVAGAPTYVPIGELALNRPLAGALPRPTYPDALAASAPSRWNGRASASLMFAANYAAAGDAVCCIGMLAGAALSAAHARLAQRREWVLSEKRLLHRAGLDAVQPLLAPAAAAAATLPATVAAVADALGVAPLTAR